MEDESVGLQMSRFQRQTLEAPEAGDRVEDSG